MHDSASELWRILLLKLSEKGCEHLSERGFGRRREAKMGRKVPFRCSLRIHRTLLRPFSDSFSTRLYPFESGRGRDTPHPSTQREGISRHLPPAALILATKVTALRNGLL